jgi:hypothetical protein
MSIFSPKKTHLHDFSDIMRSRQNLVVFLPEDDFEAARITIEILKWSDNFKSSVFFCSDFALPFYRKYFSKANLVFQVFESNNSFINKAVIINFLRSKKIFKFLKKCNGSTVIDIENRFNLQFLPKVTDNIQMLKRFSDFFKIEETKTGSKFLPGTDEISITKQKFPPNKFPNFVLDIDDAFSSRQLERLVRNLKLRFSANIIFTGKAIDSGEMINLKFIKVNDLTELILLAISADILITSKPALARFSSELEIFTFCLGVEQENLFLKCFQPDNYLEMQNLIMLKLKEMGKTDHIM